MPSSAPAEHPNTRFTAEVRERYLELLRKGGRKIKSAKAVGVSYRTIERYRADNDDFRRDEQIAVMEAVEDIEIVLHTLAQQGDLSAIKMWLSAYNRAEFGGDRTITVDATPAAVEMSKNDALAAVAAMKAELAARRDRLIEAGDIIDVPSEEVRPAPMPLPERAPGVDSGAEPDEPITHDPETGFRI